jgi:hypothetical protein
MAEKKIELDPGDKVQLCGPPDLEVLPDLYEFLETPLEDGKPSRHVIRVKGPDGHPFRVHRNRVKGVVRKEGTTEIIEPSQEEEEESMTTTETAEAKPKAKKKESATPQAFDIEAWVAEHGGIHLQKDSKFDHADYKLVSHICIDEEKKYYYTLNTYKYPDGTVSLGKTGKGGNKYPLKGRTITTTQKNNKTGQKEKKVMKGKKTAQQIFEQFTKKGYTLVSEKTVTQPNPAPTEEPQKTS